MATRTDITLKPATGSSHEQELEALASVYRFILDCRAKKKGSRPAAPDSAKGGSSDSSAKPILPR